MNIPDFSNLPKLPNFASDEMKTMTVTLRHFLIASYAIPATRVRALVPDHFALDTLKVGGETCAILQTTCFLNENFHYTPLPKPSLDFWQSTYRVLTRSPLREDTEGRAAAPGQVMVREDPGAWFFHTFLGTRVSWVLQRAVAAGAEFADFNIIQRATPNGDSYHQYLADIAPQDSPPTQIAVRSVAQRTPVAPFANWDLSLIHI